jgi:hypothetical protein
MCNLSLHPPNTNSFLHTTTVANAGELPKETPTLKCINNYQHHTFFSSPSTDLSSTLLLASPPYGPTPNSGVVAVA